MIKDLKLNIEENVGHEISGLGVNKVAIVKSKLGGVGEYDYMKLMGKPAKLATVLECFKGMPFHGAHLTLENDWVLCFNPYKGFTGLEKEGNQKSEPRVSWSLVDPLDKEED